MFMCVQNIAPILSHLCLNANHHSSASQACPLIRDREKHEPRCDLPPFSKLHKCECPVPPSHNDRELSCLCSPSYIIQLAPYRFFFSQKNILHTATLSYQPTLKETMSPDPQKQHRFQVFEMTRLKVRACCVKSKFNTK